MHTSEDAYPLIDALASACATTSTSKASASNT